MCWGYWRPRWLLTTSMRLRSRRVSVSFCSHAISAGQHADPHRQHRLCDRRQYDAVPGDIFNLLMVLQEESTGARSHIDREYEKMGSEFENSLIRFS